jgi:hypothetical protein
MLEAVARDVLRQYFKVLKKDPNISKPEVVVQAEEILGEELVNEIKEVINNEQ